LKLTANEAKGFREEIREACSLEGLLVAEARAGAAYFMRWRGFELQFKERAKLVEGPPGDARERRHNDPIPKHWQTFAARAAGLIKGRGGTSKARHAATPMGAMLNYAYIVGLGQLTRAAIGAGLVRVMGSCIHQSPDVGGIMSDIGGVMVGGAIGILGTVLGSVVGPFFLQRLKDAADKKQKRREKCEELIGVVVEHYHWFAAMRYFFISGQGSQPTLSPITKIEAITGTYFPEFEVLLRQLDSASNDYEVWILDTGQKRVRNEPGYKKLTGHEDVLAKYTAKRKEFLTELRNCARREFQ
jgi:hypothetical protein